MARLSNLPKVTQLVNGRAGNLNLNHLTPYMCYLLLH